MNAAIFFSEEDSRGVKCLNMSATNQICPSCNPVSSVYLCEVRMGESDSDRESVSTIIMHSGETLALRGKQDEPIHDLTPSYTN